jgi:hypothetical protein
MGMGTCGYVWAMGHLGLPLGLGPGPPAMGHPWAMAMHGHRPGAELLGAGS